MEKISRHISQVLEAPFLDTDVNYTAKLWCEDSGVEIKTISTVEEDTQMVVFVFSGEGVAQFEDGDVLNLTIWNSDYTQDFRAKHIYKVIDSKVEVK